VSKQLTATSTATSQMRYARICPNANGWVSPSGGNKWSNTSFPDNGKGGFGFGFDEWLLGTPVIKSGIFKGCQLGFIQAFKRQKPVVLHNVSCYWLDANKQAHLAIEIKNCQKIGDTDLLAVCREYIADDFTKKMDKDLKSLGLHAPVRCDPLEVFNVVFKAEDAHLIIPPSQSPVNEPRYSILYGK